MSGAPRVLVTGCSGNTGRLLIPRLLALGASVTTASRHPDTAEDVRWIRFDWYDPTTFDEVLADIDRVYLVPPPLDPHPRVAVTPFLARAREAGIARVVLLGASPIEAGGPGVGQVHTLVSEMFGEWVVLRPSWFMQNFIGDHFHAASIRDSDTIVTATGDGRIAFVDAYDIAHVAAHALVDEPPPGGDLVLTGPEALTYAEVAATLSEVAGRPIVHESVTPRELRQHMSQVMPAPAAAMLAQLDGLLATGIENRTTDCVQRVTGRAPRSLREMLRSALPHGMPEPGRTSN